MISAIGLSVDLSGHVSLIAFALGGLIVLLTGFSYAKLAMVMAQKFALPRPRHKVNADLKRCGKNLGCCDAVRPV